MMYLADSLHIGYHASTGETATQTRALNIQNIFTSNDHINSVLTLVFRPISGIFKNTCGHMTPYETTNDNMLNAMKERLKKIVSNLQYGIRQLHGTADLLTVNERALGYLNSPKVSDLL